MEIWAIAVIVVGSVFGLPLAVRSGHGGDRNVASAASSARRRSARREASNRRRGAVAPTGQFAMQPAASYSESNHTAPARPLPAGAYRRLHDVEHGVSAAAAIRASDLRSRRNGYRATALLMGC
uniref:Secreted protein n=1 Tax=Macrostomum lignano TaxID=282301 RepID=A0A1I8F663_9PLAT